MSKPFKFISLINLEEQELDSTFNTIQLSSEQITGFRKELIERLIEIGFKEQYVFNRIMKLDDKYFNDYTIDKFILKYYQSFLFLLFKKYCRIDNNDITFYYNKIGLREDIIEYLLPRITPLVDTCYSMWQLVEKSIELLLDCNGPIID